MRQLLTDRAPEEIHDTYSFLCGCLLLWLLHAGVTAVKDIKDSIAVDRLGPWSSLVQLLVKAGILSDRSELGNLVRSSPPCDK